MILRWIKVSVVSAAGVALLGGVMFGTDAVSYMKSSARAVRASVKDAVPIEFELQRAKDMLEDIIPELHANIRLIAQEEVEVASLKSDIERCTSSLDDEKTQVSRLRNLLNTEQVTYTVGGSRYSRGQVKEDLAHRFDRFKEAEVILAGKHRLLDTREKSLQAAMVVLDRTRAQKVQLADQVQRLESQYRLVQATAVGSGIQVDSSKLAQAEKLIRDIRKRLDVAERVLTHEARFVQPMQVNAVDEKDLLNQVDEYFSPPRGNASDSMKQPVAVTKAQPTK